MSEATNDKPARRIVSVDQLRGYAVFGMLLVNAKALFFTPVKPALEGSTLQGIFETFLYQISHHRTTFTYADTIAPLFVFVVGMGMRLSWLRRSTNDGAWEARKGLIKRYVFLVLIAFVIYAGWLWDAYGPAFTFYAGAGFTALAAVGLGLRRRDVAALGVSIDQRHQGHTVHGSGPRSLGRPAIQRGHR